MVGPLEENGPDLRPAFLIWAVFKIFQWLGCGDAGTGGKRCRQSAAPRFRVRIGPEPRRPCPPLPAMPPGTGCERWAEGGGRGRAARHCRPAAPDRMHGGRVPGPAARQPESMALSDLRIAYCPGPRARQGTDRGYREGGACKGAPAGLRPGARPVPRSGRRGQEVSCGCRAGRGGGRHPPTGREGPHACRRCPLAARQSGPPAPGPRRRLPGRPRGQGMGSRGGAHPLVAPAARPRAQGMGRAGRDRREKAGAGRISGWQGRPRPA